MASTRRSPASRSGRRRTPPKKSGSQTQVILFAGIGVVALIVVVMLANGGGSPPAEAGGTAPASTDPAPPSRNPSVDMSGGSSRAGSRPDRPAPAIQQADMDLAEQHYQRAKDLWNEGQMAHRAGDTTTFHRCLDEAWTEIEEQRDGLRAYTDWFEEADLEGWAMPAEYGALQGKLGTWDKLAQKIKKNKQMR